MKKIISKRIVQKMFKILIAGTVILPKVKKLQSYISDFFHQASSYAIVSIVVAYLPKFSEKDLMARMVQKKLATSNINVYSCQLGKL